MTGPAICSRASSNRRRQAQQPALDFGLFRAAALEADGANLVMHKALSDHAVLNPTEGVLEERASAYSCRQALARDAKRARKRARRYKPTRTIITREVPHGLPRFIIAEALLLLIGAIAALYLNNRVLATYVVQSGADLFASDAEGARIFALLALLAGLGVKVFERRLSSDGGRFLYASIFYAVAIATFLVWALTAATSFAPKVGNGSWLQIGSSFGWAPIALVLTHILSDVAWGYLIFSGAESLLLGNNKRVVVTNPEFVRAEKFAAEAEAELDDCLSQIADADIYLKAVADSRTALQALVELEFDRAIALLRAFESGALAQARHHFLNPSHS